MSKRNGRPEARVMQPSEFYDRLASRYHEIYADWGRSMAGQAAQLDWIIRAHTKGPAHTVLDASCGVGTQALGLAPEFPGTTRGMCRGGRANGGHHS
jgi:hypothetical protein